MMKASLQVGAFTVESPNDLLVASDFEQLHSITLCVITGDHCIAVWQSLHAASVIEQLLADVIIVYFPNDLALRVYFDDSIGSQKDFGATGWQLCQHHGCRSTFGDRSWRGRSRRDWRSFYSSRATFKKA